MRKIADASLPVILDDGTHKYVWGLAFAVDTSGNPLVYHADGLGSVRALTDRNGAVVEAYSYDEYGDAIASSDSITQPFQYTGEARGRGAAVPSRHLSLRLESDTYERLEAESPRAGQSRSQVAKTLLDEGLRMEAHPGIIFRSGPSGRQPDLAGGPDLWEVVRVFEGVGARGEEGLRLTAERTGLTLEQVRIAVRYYAGYRDEIDGWIRVSSAPAIFAAAGAAAQTSPRSAASSDDQ